jgi:spermidine synthase
VQHGVVITNRRVALRAGRSIEDVVNTLSRYMKRLPTVSFPCNASHNNVWRRSYCSVSHGDRSPKSAEAEDMENKLADWLKDLFLTPS